MQNGLKLGADPELFLKEKNRILGSERVVPAEGIKVRGGSVGGVGEIARDGVQIELHPKPTSGASNLMSGIYSLLTTLNQHVVAKQADMPGLSLCFDGLVKVTKNELNQLSPEARQLGCQPSLNCYGLKHVDVDPMKYLFRSGAGHIHFGITGLIHAERERMVPICDALMGIPCVLLDADNGQVERRKLYGRAGEYRLPEHGLEYRTPSNFWLKSPILADFVLQAASVAYDVFYRTVSGDSNFELALLGSLNIRKMVKAIQLNDPAIAWELWKDKIAPFLMSFKNTSPNTSYFCPQVNGMSGFEKAVEKVQKDGIAKVFGADPLTNWKEWAKQMNGFPWYGFMYKQF